MKIVLNSRPNGEPTAENFRIEETGVPQPADGEVLLRTLYLSLDPYMRGRMSDRPSYAPSVNLGEVMVGQTVSRVESSRNPKFGAGDLVLGGAGWQDYAVSDGRGLVKLNDALRRHPSYALSLLGMPAFTAWHGLLAIGEPKPGETVVVSSASGAVGSVAGQIAKIEGCRTVGIAGGAEKCRYVAQELGFDACIDRYNADFQERLAAACPSGVDVYFENVGGEVSHAVSPLLNVHARVPVCGLIATYNATSLPPGPNRVSLLMSHILTKRLKYQGFIISDHYGAEFEAFFAQMSGWVADGKVKIREDVVDGLERAPKALIGLLRGEHFGKVVVRVAPES
jgi:NADPH-dependent curcumin reductase